MAFLCAMVLPVVLILYIFTVLIWNKVYKKREALARIRHDYRNVITSALILMENGSQEKARQILSELTERISATSETPYCAIPVINAVLTEKAAICGKQGILLRTELLLPAVLQVDDFDLCIILGNLIDNAIYGPGQPVPGKVRGRQRFFPNILRILLTESSRVL